MIKPDLWEKWSCGFRIRYSFLKVTCQSKIFVITWFRLKPQFLWLKGFSTDLTRLLFNWKKLENRSESLLLFRQIRSSSVFFSSCHFCSEHLKVAVSEISTVVWRYFLSPVFFRDTRAKLSFSGSDWTSQLIDLSPLSSFLMEIFPGRTIQFLPRMEIGL